MIAYLNAPAGQPFTGEAGLSARSAVHEMLIPTMSPVSPRSASQPKAPSAVVSETRQRHPSRSAEASGKSAGKRWRAIGKQVAAQLLCAVGVPALARWRMRRKLTILMFHGVELAPLSPPCWHVIDLTLFRREMAYVRRHFNVLPIEEALERLAAGTLPDYAAALTFDDGTKNIATYAAPVLRELSLPAGIFLATGPMGTDQALWPDRLWLAFAQTETTEADLTPLGLGTRSLYSASHRGEAYAASVSRLKDLPDDERMSLLESVLTSIGWADDTDPGPFRLLSWDEAREIARDGHVALYPHSLTHPILSQCTDEKVENEIAESCLAVQRETGRAPTIFAYPNGRSQDFDERAKAVLRRHGIRWALSAAEGFADPYSDPLALPRVLIGNDLSFARFRLHISGALRA